MYILSKLVREGRQACADCRWQSGQRKAPPTGKVGGGMASEELPGIDSESPVPQVVRMDHCRKCPLGRFQETAQVLATDRVL